MKIEPSKPGLAEVLDGMTNYVKQVVLPSNTVKVTFQETTQPTLDGELAGIDMGVSTSSLEERLAQAAKDIASLEEEIGINGIRWRTVLLVVKGVITLSGR
jgi:hypothetical protein